MLAGCMCWEWEGGGVWDAGIPGRELEALMRWYLGEDREIDSRYVVILEVVSILQ
jgi:hypothetical protein